MALYGDFGELLQEQKLFEEANSLFAEAYQLGTELMKDLNFSYGTIANHNAKAMTERLQVCQELGVSLDIEQEIFKKTDRQ